jgi:uncharacterized membrane protein
MERMLVVVFESEAKAYEGSRVLEGMNEDGVITVHAARIVTKGQDGAIEVISRYDTVPEGAMGGTALGGLIGLLAGPAGLAVGAASGFAIGATADFARNRVVSDFVTEVEKALHPGKTAVVAEIHEESTDSVDTRMGALGGVVFRRGLADVADSNFEKHVRPKSRPHRRPEGMMS